MATHSTEHSKFDRLRIASPCPISWDSMTGDNRVRFCGHCQLNVYNISELSRSEAQKLIASTEGGLCARLFRRDDGTILTKDCPVGLRALRRRVAKRGAAILAAIVSLSGAVIGQQSSSKDRKSSCSPQTRITLTKINSNPSAKALSGTVLDQAGILIPGAKVTVTNIETKEIQKISTNDAGSFELTVAPGSYSIAIDLTGRKCLNVKSVVVEKDKLTNIEIILESSQTGENVGFLIDGLDLIDTPPGTTIITEKMIRNLPIQK